MSYDSDRARAQARFLAGLRGSEEVRLYLGVEPEYSRSAYKAYLRRGPGRPWYRFEGRHFELYTNWYRGPDLPRPRAVKVVACTLAELAEYEAHPDKTALVALWARARELHS